MRRRRPVHYAGWTVIAGKRSGAEWARERRGLIALLAVALVVVAVAAWASMFGPVAAVFRMADGRALMLAGDCMGAARSFELANQYSIGQDPRALLLRGQALSAAAMLEGGGEEARVLHADAAAALLQCVDAYGAARWQDTGLTPVGPEHLMSVEQIARWEAGAPPGFIIFGRDDAASQTELACAYYFLAEELAYNKDAEAAASAAETGFSLTQSEWLEELRDTILVTQPTSVVGSGMYQGLFQFTLDPAPEGVRTLYTTNGAAPGEGALEYSDGIDLAVGENTIRAVNVNRYGLLSVESAFYVLVLGGASNTNGNAVNGAIATISGEWAYFFNGDGIYRMPASHEAASSASAAFEKIVDGLNIWGLNAVGEWLYFVRGDESGYSGPEGFVGLEGATGSEGAAGLEGTASLETSASLDGFGGQGGLGVQGGIGAQGGNALAGVSQGIFRVRVDGSYMEKLSSDVPEEMLALGGKLYYTSRGMLRSLRLAAGGAAGAAVDATMDAAMDAAIDAAVDAYGDIAGDAPDDAAVDVTSNTADNGAVTAADNGAVAAADNGAVAAADNAAAISSPGSSAEDAPGALPDAEPGSGASPGQGASAPFAPPRSEALVDGDVRYLNYDGDSLFFVMDDPPQNIEAYSAGGVGSIYAYSLSNGEVRKVVGQNVEFMQVADGVIYYIEEGQSDGAVKAAWTGGAVLPPVEIGSPVRAFNVADGWLLYFDALGGALRAAPAGVAGSMGGADSVGVADSVGGTDSVVGAGVSAEQADGFELGSFGAFSRICVVGGQVYGLATDPGAPFGSSFAGYAGYARMPFGANEPTEQSLIPLSRPSMPRAAAFGGKAYAIADEGGAQSLYELDGAAALLVLSGIPKSERVLYVDDDRVIAGDFYGLTIYQLAQDPGSAQTENGGGLGEGEAAGGGLDAGAAADGEAVEGVPAEGESVEGESVEGESVEGRAVAPEEASVVDDSAADGTDVPAAGAEGQDGGAAAGLADGAQEAGGQRADAGGREAEGTQADSGRQAPDAASGPAAPDGGAVKTRRLEGGEGRVLVGVTQLEEYDGFMYFVSLAGFFVADLQLTSARLVTDDGPEQGAPFLLRDGSVYYQRDGVSSSPGIYEMALDSGTRRRLHDGLATAFDMEPGASRYLYFTSQDDLSLCRVSLENGELDRFMDLMSDMVVAAEPGLIVRDLQGGYAIDAIATGDVATRLLVPGGVDGIVAAGGFVYYNAWRDGFALCCAPLPDAFVYERVRFE